MDSFIVLLIYLSIFIILIFFELILIFLALFYLFLLFIAIYFIFTKGKRKETLSEMLRKHVSVKKDDHMFNNEYDSKYNFHENDHDVKNNSEGKNSIPVMYCRMCGNKLESGSIFCSICGTKIKISDKEN